MYKGSGITGQGEEVYSKQNKEKKASFTQCFTYDPSLKEPGKTIAVKAMLTEYRITGPVLRVLCI